MVFSLLLSSKLHLERWLIGALDTHAPPSALALDNAGLIFRQLYRISLVYATVIFGQFDLY